MTYYRADYNPPCIIKDHGERSGIWLVRPDGTKTLFEYGGLYIHCETFEGAKDALAMHWDARMKQLEKEREQAFRILLRNAILKKPGRVLA